MFVVCFLSSLVGNAVVCSTICGEYSQAARLEVPLFSARTSKSRPEASTEHKNCAFIQDITACGFNNGIIWLPMKDGPTYEIWHDMANESWSNI